MAKALRAYAQANGDQLPTDTLQLKPYFEVPVDDSTLGRYEMTGSGDMLVAEKAAVDEEYDHLFKIGLDRRMSVGVGQYAHRGTMVTLPQTPTSD